MKLLPTLYRASLCLPARILVALVMVGWLLWGPLLHAVEPRLTDGAHQQACHTLEVFVRQGCPHCSEAKSYLVALQRRHPALIITFHDIVQDTAARQRFLALSARHGVARPGVPAFLQCDEFYVGFSSEGGAIDWIEARMSGTAATIGENEISTPLGNLSVQALGLPGFTIALGLVAVAMGMVHLKDFIVPGQGLSLSIPGAAKSGLYARVRDVMYARNLGAALVAIIVLAIMVNMVELLCTAGLPALYTQILSQYGLSTLQHYGYLALYNLAYIFDDSVMVAIAVVTLGKHKLQQEEGRWLKLVSGVVVILLGLLLLLAPDRLL